MSKSSLYPARTWPVSALATHPAFMLMTREVNKSEAFYELQRIALNPDKYRDGIGWYDFIDECASSASAESAKIILERMNVFRLDTSDENNPRLITCEQVEGATAAKTGRQATSLYLSVGLASAAKAAAAERHLSMSKLVEAAIGAYLGIDVTV